MAKGFLIQRDLSKGDIFKNLLLFTLPFFFAYLLNSIYSAVDLVFIGNFSDTSNVAAVSSGTTVMFGVNSVIMGLASGGTIVIGQYFGAKYEEGIKKAIKNTILFMGVVGITTSILMIALSYPIIDWMQVEEGAKEIAQQYLFILSCGIILFTAYMTIAAILRGIGNSFAAFVFVTVAALTNIGLDYLFVKVLEQGAIGAAIATVIGEAVGLITAIVYILIRRVRYKVSLKGWFDKEYVLPIIKLGLPIALQDGLVIAGFAIVIAVLSTRGEVYTAAVGVTDRVTSFGFVPLSAISNAVSTATAQNVGAKQLDRVRKFMKTGIIFSCVTSLILGSLCMFIPRQLATIFAAHDEDTINLAVYYIQATGLDIFICAFIFPINAVFLGSGHSTFSMSQNLGTTFLIRVPFAVIACLAFTAPMYIVGLCYPASSIVSLILCIIFYFSNRWTKNIKLEEEKIES